MSKDKDIRPRWGTFSVIDHRDVASLIPEILLYDRLVFPVPTDDADWKRWEENAWQPELLRQRVQELGKLAHPARWTRARREKWSARWQRLQTLGQETEGLGRNLTPVVLAAESVWQDLVPPPIMVAAYQDPDLATADVALVEEFDIRAHARERLHREVGALFERSLKMPIVEDPERTYRRAIELAHDEGFQRARRALFAWEDRRVAEDWPSAAAINELEGSVREHDDFIQRAFRKTWTQRVYRVLSFTTPELVAAASANIFIGLGFAGALKLVEARLPALTEAVADPLDRPEAALHKAISVMYHGPLQSA